MKRHLIVLCAFAALTPVCFGTITWSDPVLLPELNNRQTGEVAYQPCISRDGSTMYFGRNDGSRRLYTAAWDSQAGTFTDVTELSGLYSGYNLYSPWVSNDELRLYYGRYVSGDGIKIFQTERTSTSESWTSYTMQFLNIHQDGYVDAYPSLSNDELTMYYASARNGANADDTRIWMSKRSSVDDQFSNPVELTELDNGHVLKGVCILNDGLVIYYAEKTNEQYDLYRASRNSLSDPFANIEAVSVNTPLGLEITATLTPDETKMFFATEQGIMYSYQIPEPATLFLLSAGGWALLRKKK